MRLALFMAGRPWASAPSIRPVAGWAFPRTFTFALELRFLGARDLQEPSAQVFLIRLDRHHHSLERERVKKLF